MSFHDIRFPVNLSFGSVGGPERRTEIVTLSNGSEERSTPWAHSRRRFDAGFGMRSLDDLETLVAFFEARSGQLFGFRWKDWTDYKSCLPSDDPGAKDQRIGQGDGVTTAFQLKKAYRSGSNTYRRPINKPVPGTVLLAVGGVEQRLDEDFTLDTTTGIATFVTPPAPDARVTAGYEFDVPVRFDTDRIETSVASFSAGEVPSVPVIEVRA
ncbi:MAG: DUF2460 domain-containing protein [Pseudomonadota bacterium]